jgi:hypothetical protein
MARRPPRVRRSILDRLRAAGWSTRGGQAWLVVEDCILWVEPQRSQWDAQVYVNCGVHLKALGVPPEPRIRDAHLQFRMESLGPRFPPALHEFEDEERREAVEALADALGGELRKLGSLDELRRLQALGQLPGGLVRKEARPLLAARQDPEALPRPRHGAGRAGLEVERQLQDSLSRAA